MKSFSTKNAVKIDQIKEKWTKSQVDRAGWALFLNQVWKGVSRNVEQLSTPLVNFNWTNENLQWQDWRS